MGKIIPPKPGAYTGITKVWQDPEYQAVRRRGRFAVEADLATNPQALVVAVEAAQEAMIDGLRRTQALVWMDGTTFELRGPLPHVGFDDDDTPDAGPTKIPQNVTRDGLMRWSNDEAKRRSIDAAKPTGLVDFMLVGTFIREIKGGYTLHIPESR